MITAIIRDLILVFVSTFRVCFGYIPDEYSCTINGTFCHVWYRLKNYSVALHLYYDDTKSFKRNKLIVSIYDKQCCNEIKEFKSTSVSGHIQNIKECVSWIKRH